MRRAYAPPRGMSSIISYIISAIQGNRNPINWFAIISVNLRLVLPSRSMGISIPPTVNNMQMPTQGTGSPACQAEIRRTSARTVAFSHSGGRSSWLLSAARNRFKSAPRRVRGHLGSFREMPRLGLIPVNCCTNCTMGTLSPIPRPQFRRRPRSRAPHTPIRAQKCTNRAERLRANPYGFVFVSSTQPPTASRLRRPAAEQSHAIFKSFHSKRTTSSPGCVNRPSPPATLESGDHNYVRAGRFPGEG